MTARARWPMRALALAFVSACGRDHPAAPLADRPASLNARSLSHVTAAAIVVPRLAHVCGSTFSADNYLSAPVAYYWRVTNGAGAGFAQAEAGRPVFMDGGNGGRESGITLYADPARSATFAPIVTSRVPCRDAAPRPVLPLTVPIVHVCENTWKAINLNPHDLIVTWTGSATGTLGLPAGDLSGSSTLYFTADASPRVTLRHRGRIVAIGVAPSRRPTCGGPQFPQIRASIAAGDAQSIVVGAQVPTPPTVRLVGPSGEPVQGATVTFSVASGYGFVSGATVPSDASGMASVGSWELSEPGSHQLRVTVSGVPVANAPLTIVASARLLNWSAQVTPGEDIGSVWGVAPDAMFASGGNQTLNFFNGTAWSAMPVPTGANRYRVHGRALNDVYSTGQWGVLRFDGTQWTEVLSTPGQEQIGVWVAPDGQAFVSGDGTFHRFDGSNWTTEPTGLSESFNVDRLENVWGSAPDNVYAVGRRGIVIRWDGTSVQRVHTGFSDQATDVFGFGPNDVYVTTAAGLLHFDGSSWILTSMGPGRTPSGIWGSSPRNLYVSTFEGEVLRYDGRSWRTVATLPSALFRVFGLGANALYIAGGSRPGVVYVGS